MVNSKAHYHCIELTADSPEKIGSEAKLSRC